MNNLEQNHYFDTNALFKYYHNEKGSLKIRCLVSNASHPIMITSDKSMQKVCEHLGIPFYDPECE